MDSMPAARPPDATALIDLPLPPLSDAADEVLRRGRAFLFAMSHGGFWTKAILHDYTESTHTMGVYHFSVLAGERAFWEWREWRALRPPRDPDLPELVRQLDAFHERWMPRALECVSALDDEGDREEVDGYIRERDERPSRTWTVKGFVQRLCGMKGIPFYQPVWDALVARGFLDELPAFDRILADIQSFIRESPLDATELADIQRSRENAAVQLQKWLADRKKELAGALDDLETEQLGLGALVPPPFEGRSASMLYKIEIAAKA